MSSSKFPALCRPHTTVRHVAPILLIALVMPMLWSCGENTETIIYEYDTVAVHDTTIRVDTLSDTLFLPAGPDSYMLFGLICDVSTTHSDSTHQFDSVYAGVTCFADPARNDLHVTVNGDSVGLETAQRDYLLFESLPDLATGSLFPGVNTLALLEATLYEGLVSKDSVSSLRIVVPAWPADTAQPLTYDTLQESIALPQPVDSYTIATSAGPVPYVTNDTALQVNYYRVPGDSALDVTWPDVAVLYAVTLQRYAVGQFGSYRVGPPLDTLLTTSEWLIPRGHLAFDTSMADSLEYDFAEMSVAPINGPPPTSWDTLPSFDNRGLLLAVNDDITYSLLIPENGYLLMGKRVAAPSMPVVERRNALELAANAVKGAR